MMGVFCVKKKSKLIMATQHNSVISYDNTLIKVLGSFFISHSVKTMIGSASLAKNFKGRDDLAISGD